MHDYSADLMHQKMTEIKTDARSGNDIDATEPAPPTPLLEKLGLSPDDIETPSAQHMSRSEMDTVRSELAEIQKVATAQTKELEMLRAENASLQGNVVSLQEALVVGQRTITYLALRTRLEASVEKEGFSTRCFPSSARFSTQPRSSPSSVKFFVPDKNPNTSSTQHTSNVRLDYRTV